MQRLQTVFYEIEKYIIDKRDLVQQWTLTVIRTMKKHLFSFQEYKKSLITFQSFDARIYEAFVKYLTYEIPLMRRSKIANGLKVNRIGKTIRHLKCFLKDRKLRDGMLHVTQKKTLSTVIVPLREDARKIPVDKYQMNLPKISSVKFNYYIKEVVRLAAITEIIKLIHRKGNRIIEESRPKFAWVSSHTARRSFCTNEYLAGTPCDLIMAISGHKTEKAFRKYIKADKMRKASMVKQIWDSRPPS